MAILDHILNITREVGIEKDKSPLFRALFFIAFFCIGFSSSVVADESLEYKVKAAFLYKFSSYVSWPTSTFNSPSGPFTICVMDSNELFNSTLDKVVNDEAINGRPVVIQQINKSEFRVNCQILYLGNSTHQRTAEILEMFRDSPTLTVSDNSQQGIINFFISDNRVRFNIDDEAASRQGLMISSKLLSLAVTVKRRMSLGE